MQSARAGISIDDFWRMTPREWSLYIEGYGLRLEDDWRRTREIVAMIFNANSTSKMTADELIPLPSDVKPLKKPLTLDERYAALERMKSMTNKRIATPNDLR